MQVMPLLAEMPAGSLGQQAISRAVYITVMGIAVAAYGVMGVFAAARFVQPFANQLMHVFVPPDLRPHAAFMCGLIGPSSRLKYVLSTSGSPAFHLAGYQSYFSPCANMHRAYRWL